MTTRSVSVFTPPEAIHALAATLGLTVEELQAYNEVDFGTAERPFQVSVPLGASEVRARHRAHGAEQERERILGILALRSEATVDLEELIAAAEDPEMSVEEATRRVEFAARAHQRAAAEARLEGLRQAEADLEAPASGIHAGHAAPQYGEDPEARADRALVVAGIRPSKN